MLCNTIQSQVWRSAQSYSSKACELEKHPYLTASPHPLYVYTVYNVSLFAVNKLRFELHGESSDIPSLLT